MAYNFTKLSDATLVDFTESTPNILIEDGGDIKRISADDLIVLNNPESSGGNSEGGNANVVTYHLSYGLDSGNYVLNGLYNHDNASYVTAQNVLDAWNNDCIIRIRDDMNSKHGTVTSISYTLESGALYNANIYYILDSGFESYTLW